MRTDRAFRHSVPVSADATYQCRDKVLVKHENQVYNRVGEWVVQHLVRGWDPGKKLFYVCDTKYGLGCSFDLTQVQKYLRTHVVLEIADCLRCLSHILDTLITELLEPENLHASSHVMDQVIKYEVQGLIKRRVFKFFKYKKVSRNTNILPCKYVLAS